MRISRTNLRLCLYFALFILPFLGMGNCHGWNEATMAVSGCFIDLPLTRSYANFYFDLALISAFLLLLPLLVYGLLSLGIVELLVRLLIRRERHGDEKVPLS